MNNQATNDENLLIRDSFGQNFNGLKIHQSSSESDCLFVEIIEDGILKNTETIDPDDEPISELAVEYFPIDPDADEAYRQKYPDIESIDPSNPELPPIDFRTITIEVDEDVQEIVEENFDSFPFDEEYYDN